jgi:hypothetical protein
LNPSGSAPSAGAAGRQPRTPIGEGDEVVEWRRDRRREKAGDAASEQPPGHAVERREVAHRVVASPPVDVQVDETRRDIRTAGVGRHPVGELDRRDVFVLDNDPTRDNGILEDEAAAEDGLGHEFGAAATGPSASGPSTSNWTSRPYRPAA